MLDQVAPKCYPVRVRAFSATVPFRGRAVRYINQMWNTVSNWWVAFVMVFEQNDTWAILRPQISPEVICMTASWVRDAAWGVQIPYNSHPKFVQNRSKRVPRGLQEASKMVLERSWGLKSLWQSFLWQRAWFVTQPQASRSLPIRSQNSPKIDHQSTLLNQLKTSSVLERFWGVLDTHFEVFFKYLRAKMISNSDKNTKMKILQNTSGFTLKMHFRTSNNVTKTLRKTLKFVHQALTKQRSTSDPPLDLKISLSSRPKTGVRVPKNDI